MRRTDFKLKFQSSKQLNKTAKIQSGENKFIKYGK